MLYGRRAQCAALHQLLRPVLGLTSRLPEPQAAALGGALGLAVPRAEDRFLVSVAVLSLLGEAAEERPVLCLVDEAQWLDRSSAEALAFVARRLEAEGVVCLFAARDGDPRDFAGAGLPELRLEGLDAEAAAALLAGAGADLPAEVVGRLVERTGGNPLALLELPGSLAPDQLAGRAPLEDVLPLTTRLEQAFGERVRRLPGPARALLLVAAAESTGDPAVVLRAGARLGAGAGELAEAEAAGLVRTGDGRLAFRHPLVRTAAYQTGTLADRQAAHRALAEVLTGQDAADQRAWHLAAATVGPDEEAAAGLERSADRARRRGGHAAAAAALERAAGLTGDDHERGRRLAAAATAAWLAGQADRAAALLDRAEPLASDPRGQAAVAHLRGSIEASRGIALHAAAMLIAGSELAAAVDPSQALQMLVEAAVRSGQPEAAAAPLAAFGQFAAAAGTQEVLAQLARCRGLAGPDEEAADRFEEALALHDGQGRPFDLARTELAYGEALRRARRRGEARTHLRSALETFQRLGAAPWAERATAELRATGETARKRDPSTLSQLTPQELQIIRLVGEGGTNREIGAQLFLSRRTIDYHLRNVFVKLGVSSRAELIRLALADRNYADR